MNIIHIDEFCKTCGFFADNEGETHNGHDYGCDHPESDDMQCYASSCPLAGLAEVLDFIELYKCTEEEAMEYAKQDDYVIME